MKSFAEIDLTDLVGQEIESDLLTVEEDRLEAFSFASYLTENDVDLTVSKNNVLGPDLVDGFLLLSLLVHFSFDKPALNVEGAYAFNYGFDNVRFTAPVMVGEPIYVKRQILQTELVSPTRARVKERIKMLKPGQEKPVMVADWIMLYIDRHSEEAGVTDGQK